jgi:hypothetical protein
MRDYLPIHRRLKLIQYAYFVFLGLFVECHRHNHSKTGILAAGPADSAINRSATAIHAKTNSKARKRQVEALDEE